MKKVLALVLALAMVMTMFVACGKKEEEVSSVVEESSVVSEAGSSSAAEGGYEAYNLACIYSEVTGDFWGIVADGCEAALEELKADYGVEGYCVGPATASDYTQQMDLIDAAKLKGVDGIVLCPSNADSIGIYVTDNFTDDSIPIIVIDRSLNTTSPAVVGTYASDAYKMAEAQAQIMYEIYGDKEATYISLGISPENKNWADRSFGCIDYCTANYPQFTSYTGEEPYWGSQVTQDQIIAYVQDTVTANPGVELCFLGTCNSYNNYIIAALSELSDEKRALINVIGWDFSMTEKANIESGAMYGAMGQNPYLMGYDSTYMMCDYLSGKELDPEATVPYQVVTTNNITSDEVQAYMKTMNLL